MFQLYALESYMVFTDPQDIAVEASIDQQLGDTKLGRDCKRLAAAVKNGDEESAERIKRELDERAKKIQAEVRREKNVQLAKNVLSLTSKAVAIGAMIYSMINTKKENNKFNELLAKGNGATAADLNFINDCRMKSNRVNKASTIIDITSSVFSLL